MKNRVHTQGTLDGLCGLYSVANAFTQLLGPDFYRHTLPDDTFREAARGLSKRVYPDMLWEGLEPDELYRSARHVARWIEGETGMGVDVSMPFRNRRFSEPTKYLSEIEQLMGERLGHAILWIDWATSKGGGAHWFVYERHTEGMLHVFNSKGPSSKRLRKLRVSGRGGDTLRPANTILLLRSRYDGERL